MFAHPKIVGVSAGVGVNRNGKTTYLPSTIVVPPAEKRLDDTGVGGEPSGRGDLVEVERIVAACGRRGVSKGRSRQEETMIETYVLVRSGRNRALERV